MLIFFFLKFALIFSAMLVVTVHSPIHSVLWLVFTFCNAMAILLYIGVDFLAFVFICVYVGAIAMLFLFCCMMLNLKFDPAEIKKDNIREIFNLSTILYLAGELSLAYISTDMLRIVNEFGDMVTFIDNINLMQALGSYLYILSSISVVLLGLILLVAMIGAILLTLHHSKGIRRQDVFIQNKRAANFAYRNVT